MKASLDIVLPCYNPTESWAEKIVQAYQELLALLPEEQIHIILVNDGSSQGIHANDIKLLNKHIKSFFYLDKKYNVGKGAALRSGVKLSKAPICIFTDVDFPYQNESFLQLFKALKTEQTDIAIGIKDTSYYSHLPWFRIKVSQFLRFLARSFLRISITDTQCGLKGFNEKGKEIFLSTSIERYLADLEFIFLADRQEELKMETIELKLKPGVIFSRVNLRILFAEGINFLKVFFRSF